ncbi:hypothetical protein OESDEN_06947 [Oesophagostomum dentatum]|uniref:TIL domain-containing protein n=1 Tax=Oesophagostomum dentatum TaxID=61180 RepID=A0A0B1TCU4_OESDE|nr:hypothetical protein OESDEN_06947 [Oesophagostomum dentatum]
MMPVINYALLRKGVTVALFLIVPTIYAVQLKSELLVGPQCKVGKVLGCTRKCYPSCANTTECPKNDKLDGVYLDRELEILSASFVATAYRQRVSDDVSSMTQCPPFVAIVPFPAARRYSYPVRVLRSYRAPYRPYPGQTATAYTCRESEIYVQCVPCERVCNSEHWLCYQYCVAGCACRDDLVRDTITNNCVTRSLCPRLFQG